MKQRILQRTFQVVIRVLLKLLSSGALVARGIGFFITRGASGLQKGARFFVPLLPWAYLGLRQLKQRVSRMIGPLRGQALHVFGHRYFVHSLVVALVLFATMPSLRAADTTGGSMFGDQTLLQELMGGEEDVVIDDTMPAKDVESYLEARFQDQPAPVSEEVSGDTASLSLDGGALSAPPLPGTSVPVTRTEIVQYTIQDGDTISSIAEQFGLSIPTILWENKLRATSLIHAGQSLTILPISGVTHKIEKGETLAQIAKKHEAALEEIQAFNKVATLAPGTTLMIPGGHPYAVPQPIVTRPNRFSSGASLAQRPTVVQGDATPAPFKPAPGKYLWPTDQHRITQYFKWRHQAVDIGGKLGVDHLYAAADGVVEYAGWGTGGWGNTVVVNHGNGMRTRYSHSSKLMVNVGDHVSQGQVLGMIGTTGHSTGPHIDFRMYLNGVSVNPLQYIR